MVLEHRGDHDGAMSMPPGAPPEEPPAADRPPPDDEGPRVTWEQVRDLGRLRRSSTDRHVAGVAGGLARHLDVDPAILRVGFVVLVFFGGAGLIVYAACWLLVPADDGAEAPIRLDDRTRTVALVVVGAFAALALLGDVLGSGWFPWPLALLALVGGVLYSRRANQGRPAAGDGAATVAPGAAGTEPNAPPGTTDPVYATDPVGGYPPGYVYGEGWYPPRPPDPRKRGPVLFWYTVGLAMTGVGALLILAAAGVDVPSSAYPAAVVVACGAMLTIGAFYGRAGGLILLGLLAAAATGATLVVDRADPQQVVERPTTAATVEETYEVGVGELVLDLTEVADPEELDEREIRVDNGVGRVEVVVPDTGLDVSGDAVVHGPGGTWIFGEDGGGVDTRTEFDHDGGEDVPALTLDVSTGVGQVTVRTESEEGRG